MTRPFGVQGVLVLSEEHRSGTPVPCLRPSGAEIPPLSTTGATLCHHLPPRQPTPRHSGSDRRPSGRARSPERHRSLLNGSVPGLYGLARPGPAGPRSAWPASGRNGLGARQVLLPRRVDRARRRDQRRRGVGDAGCTAEHDAALRRGADPPSGRCSAGTTRPRSPTCADHRASGARRDRGSRRSGRSTGNGGCRGRTRPAATAAPRRGTAPGRSARAGSPTGPARRGARSGTRRRCGARSRPCP